MDKRTLRLGAGSAALVGLLLVLVAMVFQAQGPAPHTPLALGDFASLFLESQVAFAAPAGPVIDHGDPDIADEHVAFRDRGHYSYQDMICGTGCGGTCVNVVHGNLIYTRQDISIPSWGLPLEIRFTYNSGSFFNGRYGYGWQMNYNLRYITNNVNDNVIVVREDDRTDIFVKRNGAFHSTYGVKDTLEEYEPGHYLLTDQKGVKYWFASDLHHYVTKIEDLNGNTLTFSYSGRQLSAVSDGTGRSLTFTYTNNKLATITAPGGRTFRYQYQGDNLIKVTDPEGSVTNYAYTGDCHDLESITDARGNVRTIAYNEDYQVEEVATCCGSYQFAYNTTAGETSVTDSNGYTTSYAYDGKNRVTSARDPDGTRFSRTWDDEYDLASITDARGNMTQYTYDARGNTLTETDAQGKTTTYTWHQDFNRVTSVKNARGHTTDYAYDPQGNLTTHTDSEGNITGYTYDGHGKVLSRTDPRGYTMHYQYDANGNLKKEWLTGPTATTSNTPAAATAPNYVTNYSYDPVGNRISETDANGNITTYSYDSLNRLVTITDALGYVSNYSYDPVGNRISETDANGHTISYSYDDLNRLVVITKALECVVQYEYDSLGNRISETDANGNVTTYSYDSLNRLVVITDALGYVSNYSYDPVGNRISETDANGHTISYSYDTLNRLDTITDALGYVSNYSYDPVGNRISETDANGHTISYSYDGMGELTVITNPQGFTTTYTYDPVGNRISRTDANNHQWKYEYDSLNRLVTGTSPLMNQTAYEYDGVGNVIGRTDPNGIETGYSYDDLNRLAKTEYADGTAVDYEYDCMGNTLVITDGGPMAEIISREYDELYRLVSETIDYPLFDKQVVYTYDKVGNIKALTDPDGRVIQYEYDGANQLVEVTYPTNKVTTMSYDGAGRRAEMHYPNGLWALYGYDDANQVTSITVRNASNVQQVKYEYVYDAVGRVQRVDKNGVQQMEFGYDGAGRLTQADYSPIVDYGYSYDPVGNRLSQDDGAQITTYEYDAEDRVILQDIAPPGSSNDIQYFHDANGNVTGTFSLGFGPVDYAYDFENHLIGFQHGTDYTAIYYSPEGALLARDEKGPGWVYYQPSLMGTVVEMDGAGQTTTRLNPGISMGPGGALVAQGIQATPEAYVHWDGRNNTSYFSDNGGAPVEDYEFGYFGEMLTGTVPSDVEPGLYASGMKVDFDPVIGAELIGGDYAPDIVQHYGATMFEPGEHLATEYDWHYVQWLDGSPWANTSGDSVVNNGGMLEAPKPDKKAEKCTHGCYGFAWGKKYVEWPGEWKKKWTCRQMDYVEACHKAKPAAKGFADKDCEYWDGPECECKGKYGKSDDFDWIKQRSGEGWICYCKMTYIGNCVEK